MAVQPDGKIVAGGATSISGKGDFALARYESRAGTPAGLIDDLEGLARCIQLPDGIENSLLAKLEKARSAVSEGNPHQACGHLGAFGNEVGARSGKGALSDSDGMDLQSQAQQIAADLGCAS